jgi:hypothetical protein
MNPTWKELPTITGGPCTLDPFAAEAGMNSNGV